MVNRLTDGKFELISTDIFNVLVSPGLMGHVAPRSQIFGTLSGRVGHNTPRLPHMTM